MPKKKVQKDVKSIDLEPQSDLNEGVDTEVGGCLKEPLPKAKNVDTWEWAKTKGDSPYFVSGLKIVKPSPGKPMEGTPYYVNNRMVGYLVVK